jgi:hypothetical protein
MKKLLMLFLVVATALSCSDDDNNSTSNPTGSLVGTWRLTEMYDGNTPVVTTTCDLSNQLKFNADNTAQVTVAISSGTQCNTTTLNGVYVVAGNALTINTLGLQQGYEIIEQTATKLHIAPINGDVNAYSSVYTKQ